MNEKDLAKGITKQDQDYSQWYLDVIKAADLAEHAEIKGCMIIKPYGYAIWENFQKILDQKIKETGHQNLYFPLFIPESLLKKEKEHVQGFSPELAVVTYAGGEKLKEPLIIRPTSETVMYATFSKWISSWRDLPLLTNQWANVVRWEKRPRLFLRTTEFLWQEGHTAHATENEAKEEALKMLNVYQKFSEEYLAIPVFTGQKTESEKFAGALRTYCLEAIMPDGKALQMGTSHELGQNFAKVFNVKYTDKNGQKKFVWQTSWGVSTRLIGGLIMAHSDDKGLVLPPKIAPWQVVIIPIWKNSQEKKAVLRQIERIENDLKKDKISYRIDNREKETPGEKFYEWEKKGVPLRLEIGPKDIKKNQVILVRRDTSNKDSIDLGRVCNTILKLLEQMQKDLYSKAQKNQRGLQHETNEYSEFKKVLDQGGFIMANWCGQAKCEEQIKEETKATIRCLLFKKQKNIGQCIKCGRQSVHKVVFARAY